MNAKYFDAHCHVQFDAFDTDQAEIIEKMKEQEVAGIVVGCDFESSRKAVELVEGHENLYASVGLHPNRTQAEGFDVATYRLLAENPKVVAIGECGLDYFRPAEVNDEIKNTQKTVLKLHIALAAELDKPLIIHSRPSKGTMDAYQDLIAILKEAKIKYPNLRGDIHFFVGGIGEAQAFFDLGFTISFTAVITFARDYDQVIRSAPLNMILSETDSPYVPPTNRARGSRNDPLAVQDVVAKVAEIRGEDLETVHLALLQNAKNLFKIRPIFNNTLTE
jgi:TatD DNase family protein